MSWPDVERERVLRKVTRRLVPFSFICYVIAYIDRVNIGFASAVLQRDLGLSQRGVRVRGRPVLPRLLPVRDPQQPDPRARRRAALDRAHHDRLGPRLDGDDVRHRQVELLRRARPARAGGGRLLPGHGALPDLLDPGRASARATGALFMMAAPVAIMVGAPVSEALLQLDGWLGLARLAVAVPARGTARRRARRRGALRADRSARAGEWLDPEDRALAQRRHGRRSARRRASRHAARLQGRCRAAKRAGCSASFYFLNTTVTYGIFLWLPRDAAGGVRDRPASRQRVTRSRSSRRSSPWCWSGATRIGPASASGTWRRAR